MKDFRLRRAFEEWVRTLSLSWTTTLAQLIPECLHGQCEGISNLVEVQLQAAKTMQVSSNAVLAEYRVCRHFPN